VICSEIIHSFYCSSSNLHKSNEIILLATHPLATGYTPPIGFSPLCGHGFLVKTRK
jgi:hypothetical protein